VSFPRWSGAEVDEKREYREHDPGCPAASAATSSAPTAQMEFSAGSRGLHALCVDPMATSQPVPFPNRPTNATECVPPHVRHLPLVLRVICALPTCFLTTPAFFRPAPRPQLRPWVVFPAIQVRNELNESRNPPVQHAGSHGPGNVFKTFSGIFLINRYAASRTTNLACRTNFQFVRLSSTWRRRTRRFGMSKRHTISAKHPSSASRAKSVLACASPPGRPQQFRWQNAVMRTGPVPTLCFTVFWPPLAARPRYVIHFNSRGL